VELKDIGCKLHVVAAEAIATVGDGNGLTVTATEVVFTQPVLEFDPVRVYEPEVVGLSVQGPFAPPAETAVPCHTYEVKSPTVLVKLIGAEGVVEQIAVDALLRVNAGGAE
jgi:hypothetical protein